MTIRFREEHLRKFSAASLDRSPMHLSESYARKSAIGERAVYGVLGVLACLRGVALPAGSLISKVKVQYHSPLTLDVDYSIQVKDQSKEGGFKRSSQHLERGNCDDYTKAPFRSMRASTIAVTRPTSGSTAGE